MAGTRLGCTETCDTAIAPVQLSGVASPYRPVAETGGFAGRDPKPWPPPFKLNREMVEAMGGADSEGYRAFCAHACEAYNILRKSASLILSLFHLMAGAAIPDVRADPEKVILKLQVR